MKKQYFIPLVILVSLLVLPSCRRKGCTDEAAINYDEKAKRDDGSCEFDTSGNIPPVITIFGDNPATIFLGDSYVDAGAEAVNSDGSAAQVSVNDSDLNTSEVGTYEIIYSASNEFGNAEATREVIVTLGNGNFIGEYEITSNCSQTAFPLNGTVELDLIGETGVVMNNVFNLVGGSIEGTVNGTTLTIPQQSVNITLGNIELSGTGTMNNTATQMVVNYNYNNTTPLIGGSGSCTATYTKL
ncbi:MAG: DUF5011 domain-containing protein [Crocinitomicaceae bacterium]|nr:DUF5011 domain-containing protein [Crocinitomicaceae bacterium]